MRGLTRWAVSMGVCVAASVSAAPVEVINEDFEAGMPPGVGIVNVANGNVQAQDDGSAFNSVLMLTQGVNDQGGWAWFPDTFDLANRRVEIEFDLFIGRGASATPADGVSVIFQFDGDLAARGDFGGGLGCGNLRSAGGARYEYVAVSFDIWDNGGVDTEFPTDGRYGVNSTAHVEVNQNIDPENTQSQAEADSPDYIASADVYGYPPGTPGTVGTYNPEDLIHVTIIFDSRLMLVTMEGGVASDGFSPFPETTAINTATAGFPDRLANIGFTATTGSANAWQWIDNLVVREDDSRVSIVPEAPLTAGAMNCAGGAVDATAEIGVDFRAEATFGQELSRIGDIATGLTITLSRLGRVLQGADYTNANPRPIDVSGIPGAGAETAKVFINDAWSTVGVEYLAEVVPGRYEVTLYWSENYTGAVNGVGQGTKLYDVYVNGERVLCNWSAAAAAGSPTGSGDPRETCVGRVDTAVARTFSVDVPDDGGGVGSLLVRVDDLGGGNPPEHAALNALSFERTGDATGEGASGDLECIAVDPGTPPAGELISTDFPNDPLGSCPPGMVCNSNNVVPQISENLRIGGTQLRITDDATASTAATAIFEQTVNVLDHSFTAEFDIFMDNPDGAGVPTAPGFEAADGAAFFVMEGANTSALGGAGGAMGIPRNAYGFAIEFDTWLGGGNNEPSGFNSTQPFTHVGINNMSTDSTITNVQFDPNLRPVSLGGTGWPNFFDQDGVHVKVEYDAGHVSVELEGVTELFNSFGAVTVAEADIAPIFSTEAVVGFAAGTGGRTQDTFIDDVRITAEPGVPGEDAMSVALQQARDRWNDGAGELYINCGGPTLFCSAHQYPATGGYWEDNPDDPGTPIPTDVGDPVVWVGDQATGSSMAENEFFAVTPLPNANGAANNLNWAWTNIMGIWDARGTEPGVDDNDRMFQSERYADHQYDIPVPNGTYEVTLYFANSHSGTAGTAVRFYHLDVEGERKGGFWHCENSGRLFGIPQANPIFGWDDIFDPVDLAEHLHSPDPCNFAECENNLVTVSNDPDADQITAESECGNAAAVALRYEVEVEDGAITVACVDTDPELLEPVSPDGNPKISGIAVRAAGGPPPAGFVRGDANSDGSINLTDGVVVLNYLFLGAAPPACMDAADPDDQGNGNPVLTDAVVVFNWLFTGGPAPAPPSPSQAAYAVGDCGPDPTPNDGMDCASPPAKCSP